MSEGSGSNTRVRVNVAFFDPSRIRPGTDFQAGLTWEELRQYRDLFWNNQTENVMRHITPAQLQEKEFLERNNIKLPDPFDAVCTAHEAFLPPEIVAEPPDEEEDAAVTESVDSDVEVEITQEAESPGVPDPQAAVYGSDPTSKYLVLAPPGTGKTYTVLKRFAFLEQHYDGDLTPVLGVTFSRAASAELQMRLVEELESSSSQSIEQLPDLRTLDSFSGRVLAATGESLSVGDYDASIRKLAEVLEGQHGKDAERKAGNVIKQKVGVVIVDEVQDIVGVRARLLVNILALFKGKPLGLTVLGDLRQSIYGFQLSPDKCPVPEERKMTPFWLVRQIESLYPDIKAVNLDKAWRFNYDIQEIMRDLRGAMDDSAKGIKPGERPDRIRLREIFEDITELGDPVELGGDITAGKRTAILARTNSQVKRLEVSCTEILEACERKVRIVSGSSIDAVAKFPGWIGRMVGKKDSPDQFSEGSFLEHYEAEVNFNRPEATQRLEALWAALKFDRESFSKETIVRAIAGSDSVPSDLREKPVENEIWISTIHQAKGREFDVVVVSEPFGMLAENNEDEAENCRVAYVAATRAKKELYRCGGKRWEPEIFQFEDRHFDFDTMIAVEAQAEDDWYQLQDELWQSHLELGSLRLFSPDGARFVLEVKDSAVHGRWPVHFSDRFTVDFIAHARKHLGVNDPLVRSFMVKIIQLNTVVSGPDSRVLLVPDLSGNISAG